LENWREYVELKVGNQAEVIAKLNLEEKAVSYSQKIKHHRNLKVITGDEEIVRAFLLDRLVNELDYAPEYLETEKEYTIRGGHNKINPRIDVIVKDEDGSPFFFIEAKAPHKYEEGKEDIEGQLFSLAQAEEKDFKTKVKYLVYYTAEVLEDKLVDRVIIIDFEKYPTYADWEADGFISIGTTLTPGYGEPKKQPLIKGHKDHDLRIRINKNEIENLGKNLHNVLWGGGGTTDSEIFYSLVNIILAKIQDEYEKEDGQDYDFQVYQYGTNPESYSKIYDRINQLFKRALRDQMNVVDDEKINEENVINRNKLQLSKLVYTVQALESISFLGGRNSLDGKDILGDFFENITREGFKQDKGQFFTPAPVVKFLLYAIQLDTLAIERLNNDKELPLIIDPSAGSGTYLVEAMKLITRELKYKQRNKIKSSKQIEKRFEELFTPDHNENKWAREYLYGSEINFDLGTASKVNMILHGDGSTNIFVESGLLPFRLYKKETSPNYLETYGEDPLYADKEVNGKFDVVVSNPPFSVDLDTQTKRGIKNSFLFGSKKNSENLFIERYYQLLKEGGRLGVVLPESVFDTVENKYIRLFIFKYFNVKAIISLPEVTFEPHTSTKTSLLLAQKKTKKEIKVWNEVWDKYGKEWGLLKTRINDYILYYVYGKPLNKRWAADVVNDIENENEENILSNIYRFLKDYLDEGDTELEIEDILDKYSEEIKTLMSIEKETEVFGYYNAWWVFGEVAKELEYEIKMAEAENVGYKRSKKGTEKAMPNDLFDIEYAPNHLDCDMVIERFNNQIIAFQDKLREYNEEKAVLESKLKEKKTATSTKRLDRVNEEIYKIETVLNELEVEKIDVESFLSNYYEENELKRFYLGREDEELIHYFKNGKLAEYKSTDIVLREANSAKILDNIRQGVFWD